MYLKITMLIIYLVPLHNFCIGILSLEQFLKYIVQYLLKYIIYLIDYLFIVCIIQSIGINKHYILFRRIVRGYRLVNNFVLGSRSGYLRSKITCYQNGCTYSLVTAGK